MKHRHSAEGEFVIDHRASPGISEAFARQSGKDVPAVGAGELYESATITCSHCQATVVLNPQRTRPRHYCAKCDHYICDDPICLAHCLPIAKVFDVLQDRAVTGVTTAAAVEILDSLKLRGL